MRIDFFFFESEGGGTEFHPINICVYYEIEKKKKKKRSYQIYVYNEIEKEKEKRKRNDWVK